MGKIRVKTFDDTQDERDEKRKAQREQKKLEKKKDESPIAAEESLETITVETTEAPKTEEKKVSKYKEKTKAAKSPSARYSENKKMVGVKTTYPINTAIEILKKMKTTKFDETVELHVNVKEKGVAGQVTLPHGTGKKRVIKVADDETIAAIEKGVIDFDVLVAHPSMMPKLAKVARVLGPRGLMPNPKNGTVTPNTDAIVEKLSAGQMNFKTEADAPIIHMTVGKVSFSDNQIQDNINAAIGAIKAQNITKVTLKSTMSPAIYIDSSKLS